MNDVALCIIKEGLSNLTKIIIIRRRIITFLLYSPKPSILIIWSFEISPCLWRETKLNDFIKSLSDEPSTSFSIPKRIPCLLWIGNICNKIQNDSYNSEKRFRSWRQQEVGESVFSIWSPGLSRSEPLCHASPERTPLREKQRGRTKG